MVQENNPTEVSPIETALAEQNITAQVIAKLKTDYSGLKINGIDDKEGFKRVEEARKECKAIRILAEKICKSGREEAIQIQKAWIAKEKEVVAQIEEVELALKAESERIKEEEKAILFKAAQQAKLPMRKEKLLSIGIEIEEAKLLELDDAQFSQLFNEFYEKHLEEKAQKIREEEEKRQAEIAEAKRIEQEKKQKIYNQRKEALLPYWNFLKGDQISIDFSEISEEDFQIIFKECFDAKEKHEEEQAEIAKENARLKAEKEKADAELKAQQEKAEKEKAEAEAKQKALEKELAEKKAAEEKAKKEAEAIEKAKKEEEKKLAKAPDKEKLKKLIYDLSFETPKMNTEEGTIKLQLIYDKFAGFKNWAYEQIDSM